MKLTSVLCLFFFFSSRRRHTRYWRDWSSDVCSSDLGPDPLYEVRLSVRARGRPAAGCDRGRHCPDHAQASRAQGAGHLEAGCGTGFRPYPYRENGCGEALMITLGQLLTLSGILFSLSVAGIFLNRKNVILLLMCIELLLLAANFNFIAFSRYLGDIHGQVFVFFVLTVAAAESAIGLAILVVLFRERRSINVEDLNTLRG